MTTTIKTLKAKIAAARERSEAIGKEIKKASIETTLLEIQVKEIKDEAKFE